MANFSFIQILVRSLIYLSKVLLWFWRLVNQASFKFFRIVDLDYLKVVIRPLLSYFYIKIGNNSKALKININSLFFLFFSFGVFLLFIDPFLLQTVGTCRHVAPLEICIFNAFGPFEPLLQHLVLRLCRRRTWRREVLFHWESKGQFHYLSSWIKGLSWDRRWLLGWSETREGVRKVLLLRWAWDSART